MPTRIARDRSTSALLDPVPGVRWRRPGAHNSTYRERRRATCRGATVLRDPILVIGAADAEPGRRAGLPGRSSWPRFRTRQPGRIFATPRCPLPTKLLAKHAYLRVLGPSSKSGGLHAHGSARGLYPPGPEARKRRGGGRRVERVSGTGRSQAPSALRATLSLRLCAWPRFPLLQLHGAAKSLKGQPVPGGVGGRVGKRG